MFTWTNSEQLYSYQSFISRPNLLSKINLITLMAYDLNYGNDYVSTNPTAMYREILSVAKQQFRTQYQNKVIIGLNTYGTCKNMITGEVQPLQGIDLKLKTGWGNWITDPAYLDGSDLTWRSGDQICAYPDKTTHQTRMNIAREYGFNQFVFWSIGAGNNWLI
jgi:spore germination protein YaaH